MSADLVTIAGGAIVGLVLGIVGGGGSILAVPLLLYGVGMPSVHAAIGTSAVAVALNAAANLLMAAKRGLVKWRCGLVFAAAGMNGSLAGSHLALMMDGRKLLALFGGLMIMVGALMLAKKNAEGDPDVRLTFSSARHMVPWLVAVGMVVGVLAGFFGIGGGFLIVPGLMFASGMPIGFAVATSLVGVAAFGASTAFSYALAGAIDWRVMAFFLGGGLIGSVVGQGFAGRLILHKSAMQAVFAAFVIIVGGFIVHQAWATPV
ncbi:sulfite exporter TauE/SafE family protein [Aestuariivirga litoralis]|uniref:sulfite exporter TauE/SafE family protein n=1 Tax=Aestuariivirga litoralis TaxID=2650924 RepID=UPI0032B28C4C